MTPVIETERLVLRAPVADDQDGFAAFLMSPRAIYAGGTQDRAEADSEFQDMIDFWNAAELGTFTMVRKDNGAAVGHVGGLKPEGWPDVELGWAIWRDEDEGQGFASEAAKAVLDYAFNSLGWKTAISYVAPDNKKSIKMTERLGARLDADAAKPEGLTCLVYRHRSLPAGTHEWGRNETPTIPSLKTERLVLRAPRLDDIDTYVEFSAVSNSKVGKYRGGQTLEEIRETLQDDIAHWKKGFGMWLLTLPNGEIVGGAGLCHPDNWPSHELTWWLMPNHRGRGYATEASLAVIEFGYGALGWAAVETHMRDENTAARKLAERLGGKVTRRNTFPDGVSRDVFILPRQTMEATQ